jgi:hypothetical protein
MFAPIKNRADRDKLAKDYLETKDRVKQKFFLQNIGEADSQEDARKIFKPITDNQTKTAEKITKTQQEITETIKQEIPKALTYAISKALPSTEVPAIDQAISLGSPEKSIESISSPKVDKSIEYFMNNVDRNLNLDTVRKYSFPSVSELIGDPNNPNLDQMKQILSFKNQQGSLTNQKNKITRKINNKRTPISDVDKATLHQEYDELVTYGKQVNNAYKFFNNIVKGQGINKGQGTNKGQGINYYHDPIQLYNRLALLVASKDAGNTGVQNEISEIIDEWLETRVIDKATAKILFQKYIVNGSRS